MNVVSPDALWIGSPVLVEPALKVSDIPKPRLASVQKAMSMPDSSQMSQRGNPPKGFIEVMSAKGKFPNLDTIPSRFQFHVATLQRGYQGSYSVLREDELPQEDDCRHPSL